MPRNDKCRAEMVAFAAVVVDDIENDLDPGIVQPLDRGLEAGDRLRRQKTRIRREKADRIVAPIIDEPAFDQMAVVDRGMDRQQLDRGDPEADEIIDHRRRNETRRKCRDARDRHRDA